MSAPRRPTFVVFDIDGVLADVGHRLHYLATRPKDWTGFFRSASDDPPLDAGVQRAFAAHAEGHTIVYLTGRPENYRTATQEWLTKYGFPQGAMHMRRSHDHRPARFTKIVVLRELAKVGEIVEFVDDDADVVAAARAARFPVHHATWMVVTTYEQGELFDAQDVEGRS